MSSADNYAHHLSPPCCSLSKHVARSGAHQYARANTADESDVYQHPAWNTITSHRLEPTHHRLRVQVRVAVMGSPGLRLQTRRAGWLGLGPAHCHGRCLRVCWQGCLWTARWVLSPQTQTSAALPAHTTTYSRVQASRSHVCNAMCVLVDSGASEPLADSLGDCLDARSIDLLMRRDGQLRKRRSP